MYCVSKIGNCKGNTHKKKDLFNLLALTGALREGVQMKKTFLNGHCTFRGGGGRPLPDWFGPFLDALASLDFTLVSESVSES